MLLRRAAAGVAVVFGVSVYSWTRAGDADHPPADPVRRVAAAAAEDHPGGNYADAAHRFRTHQPRHWRHVVIGGR